MAEITGNTSIAKALFVFHVWDKDKYGLPAFHRILIQDFCRRKHDTMEVYATTLDIEIDLKKTDAKSIGVKLIGATRKTRACARKDPPSLIWLLNHEAYYPDLKKLENVKFVIGYAPETYSAAADIRETLFQDAELVLINHATESTDYDEDFEEYMLKAASEANMLFSIGPRAYQHFENEYRAEYDDKKLSDIPHSEIAPKPCFSVDKTPPKNVSKPVLFTYGRIDSEKALKRCEPIAIAVGNFSRNWRTHSKNTPTWKIQDISGKNETGERSMQFLTENLGVSNTKPLLCSDYSIRKLKRHISQCDLCVPVPDIDDCSFDGVEAMSSTVPLVSLEDNHLADFIDKYFKDHIESCIVKQTVSHLTEGLHKVFQNTTVSFENAKTLKRDYKDGKEVDLTYANFAAVLTPPSKNVLPSEDNPAMGGLEVIFRLADDWYHQHRQSLSHHDEVKRLDVAWSAYRSSFDGVIDALLPDEGRRQQVRQVIEDKCGCVDVLSMEKGSLAVTLHVPRLINLYRLERTTKSGSLAEAMEPVLITDEANAMAERAGIPRKLLKLQVIYDQGTFQAIQQFLIKRDGGTICQTFSSEDDIEELREDDIQYEQYEFEEEENPDKRGTEIGSERECEDCRNLKEMYERECKRHDEREQNLSKKLTRQYSRIRELEGNILKLTPSENTTDQGRKSEAEMIRLEWKVKTFGDAEDPVLLDYPCGVTFCDKNHLAVCDRDNYRVDVIDMVTKRASYLKFEGLFENPFRPQDIAISADNLLFITDRGNRQIVVSDVDSKEVRTFGHEQVKFEPFGIALMGNHAIVSDTAEHRILKYTTDGEYVDEIGGYGKGVGQFNEPYSVAINSQNQVLATDFHNHRVQVFNSDLKHLRSVGTSGSLPGQLQNPYGINVDSDDNMYVCDFDNHRVAKFTKEGKFECNLFESDVNYPMYVAVSKGKADQFRIAVSQWQEDKITVFSQFTDK
ncbi:uncharacterized protein [Ptychodera flava]|uniref:uncharacterized protein n=1 Tax=Ptychodera flava TaxID=63121 RepID=UPI00396AA0D7